VPVSLGKKLLERSIKQKQLVTCCEVAEAFDAEELRLGHNRASFFPENIARQTTARRQPVQGDREKLLFSRLWACAAGCPVSSFRSLTL